jgi:hypothetical protein
MAIIQRNFTYRRRIKVSSADLRLAKAGRKTCTIRLGKLSVEGDVLDLSDGRENVKIKLLCVENDKYFKDLNDSHAQREGFSKLEELVQDLKRYYRNIEDLQPITIINFKVLDTG